MENPWSVDEELAKDQERKELEQKLMFERNSDEDFYKCQDPMLCHISFNRGYMAAIERFKEQFEKNNLTQVSNVNQ